MIAPADNLIEHWHILVLIWLALNVVASMPSPEATGPTASWWYKWLFGSLHGIAGMLPRVIATLFPQYNKFMPGNGGNGGNGGTNSSGPGNSSGPNQ